MSAHKDNITHTIISFPIEVLKLLSSLPLRDDELIKKVGLFLYTLKLRKKAPLCRYYKSDGTKCQRRLRPPAKFCYHHRKNKQNQLPYESIIKKNVEISNFQ